MSGVPLQPRALVFDSMTEAHTADDVTSWLNALPEGEALALCTTDSAVSLACGKALLTAAPGDLLAPGL